jgi:hypothetical protein
MRKLVRDRLGVAPGDQFITDDVIDSNLNLAIMSFEAEHRWPWNEAEAEVYYNASENAKSLPSDWRATRAVLYGDREVQPVTRYDMHRLGDEHGEPVNYSVVDQVLYLWPTPMHALTVTVLYYREPKLLAQDADEPRCPPEHLLALVAKACQYCAQREAERFEAQDHAIEYELAVQRARKDVDRHAIRGKGRRIRPGAWV